MKLSILLIIIFLFLFTNDLFIQFLLMESSTLMVILFMNLFENNKLLSLIYFSFSVVTTFLLMFFFLFDLFNSDLNMLISLILLMKMGLFPFYMLSFYVFNNLNWNSIFLLGVYNKFFIIKFFCSVIDMNVYLFSYLMLNSLFISMLSYSQKSLKKLIFCSMTNQSSLLMMLIYVNELAYLFYFLFYSLISFILFKYFYMLNINGKKDLLYMFNFNKFFIFLFLIYVCLPPMGSFLLKFMLFFNLLESGSNSLNLSLMMMVISLSSIFMIWNYFSLILLINLKFDKFKFNLIFNISFKFIMFFSCFFFFYLFLIMNLY